MPLTAVNPDLYEEQLRAKAERIRAQFAEFNPPPISVFDSPPLHFRQRAEFRVWHEGDDSYCVMFDPQQPKVPVRIDEYVIGSRRLIDTMQALMREVRTSELLRSRLFQVEFLTTLSGEALVTLIYHRKLDDTWQTEAQRLQSLLGAGIIGRSKKQKRVLSDDYVTETLTVDGITYQWQQVENSFTQPNASVNQKMLGWARQQTRALGGDLLELYCGNGNFTVVLADHFDRVLATEISKTSVKSALHNFTANGIDNTEVVRISSEEFTQAMDGVRQFRRLQNIDLGDYRFSTLLVDPPRAGLDKGTEQLATRFDNIIYISCNPDTLYSNLLELCETHTIRQFAIFDQFPYTHHIECGVHLQRRTA